jgi:hypothetical protein
MSQIDFKNALARLVAQMRGAGYSVPEIVALVIGDTTPKAAAPVISAPEQPRMIAVEHSNGTTRLIPWSPQLQAELDREAKAKVQTKLTPAPKPAMPQTHDIVRAPIGNTTYDLQNVAYVAEEYHAPEPTDNDDLDALIAEQEADLVKLRALRGK